MPTPSLPCSLADLLIVFRPCFTAPTFATFRAMVAGFLAQPGLRTVTGMLVGARLAGRRHHDLAYRFFATARWSADQLGLVLLDLITMMLVSPDAAVVLAVDDTLWRRTGRRLHGAAWHHDGAGPGRHRPAWGHRWVVVGAVVHLPFLDRAVCLPILARLWLPGDPDRTPLVLARELVDLVTGHLGDRPVHLVGDAAYIGKPLRGLPTHVTVTARLRADAALYAPPPPPSGQPGIKGAHEKGGVEGQVGWFRRNHLVPVPEVDSLAELNQLVDRWDAEDDARRIGTRPRTVGEHFAVERPLLKPLPAEPFETGLQLGLRVDRYSQITVRTNRYSVPVRLIGRRVRVMLGASELVVYDRHEEVARHERLIAKAGVHLELDHYLEALVRKPGALPGATALEQARAAGKFTPAHDAWWAAACKAHGDRDRTRALIEVLLLGRHLAHGHVVAGLAAALRAGALTCDAVALEARKAAETAETAGADASTLALAPALPGSAPPDGATVTFLTERRLAHLPPDTRPLPSVAVYDQLLRRPRPGAERPAEGESP